MHINRLKLDHGGNVSTMWVYQSPNRRQFTIRCPNGNDWTIYNEVLSRPVSFRTLQRVPLHPTRFEHCPTSTEAPTRSWKLFPCIYRMYRLYWRFTSYKYNKIFRRRPERWINSRDIYKHRNGPITWTRYFNYGRLHRFEKVSNIGTWLSSRRPVCPI